MRRKLGWLLVGVGYVALVVYGAFGDTGPIGWLDSFQQQHFGSYSQKLSFLVVCVGALLLGSPLLVWLTTADRNAKRTVGAMQPRPAHGTWATAEKAARDASRRPWRAPVRALTAILAGCALAWAGALAWGAWDAHQRSGDIGARYVAVEPGRAEPLPSGADHLALDGRLLWERVVAKRKTSASTPEEELVPIVGPAWREGDAVRFVARIGSDDRNLDRQPRRRFGAPLLVRLGAALPTAATPIFAKMGAPLADNAVGVTLVPSRDGAITETGAFNWTTVTLVSTVLSVIWALSVIAIAGASWTARRRAARAEGDRAGLGRDTGSSGTRVSVASSADARAGAADGLPIALDGQARIGTASRRGAKLLVVQHDRLSLTCFHRYEFARDDVVAIRREGPAWLRAGIRIVHNRADYPADMLFAARGGAEEILRRIASTGFVASGTGPAHVSPARTIGRLLFAAIALYCIGYLLYAVLR